MGKLGCFIEKDQKSACDVLHFQIMQTKEKEHLARLTCSHGIPSVVSHRCVVFSLEAVLFDLHQQRWTSVSTISVCIL